MPENKKWKGRRDPQNERTEGSGRERRDKGEGENLAVVVRRRRT